ncbi:GGDEF domain-containing response regulator [Caminicella sporogenes]|uniref:GGDEF domain-containing response regulator n=1 Tax=Caminicella sporogenes TaxID=166485 RepID=UPI0025416C14|nr:GGDEF domain-containing response regulator [Caminicella sporogenes]WIF95364.1 GGDEF domain-containing response regulator [Caminicella sporogenes]
MEIGTIKILLIEDSNFDARIISDMLTNIESKDFIKTQFKISWVKNLSQALDILEKNYFDIILLDLTLPDSMGIDTLKKVNTEFPEVPIIVMTSLNDHIIAINAVKSGAQDYLIKGQFNTNLLLRAIYYSIERHKMLVALRSMALIDQLTGLYNRHGFMNLAQHHIKLAKRKNKDLLIMYCDLDNLKYINDNYGHVEGDNIIKDTANILKSTFRESDVISRFGGDEFVVLAIDVSREVICKLIDRLEKNIREHNKNMKKPYKISMSIGVKVFNPNCSDEIEEILNEADRLMYKNKKLKKKGKRLFPC